ncbi:hypothetical protein Ae706Ps2_6671 [Pseudonocardia sp. Ae706_Ps2]|nr:hypothetical protein Ae706Ps2_6671 [Pseudonocardia sp. Ae706_Ps2]
MSESVSESVSELIGAGRVLRGWREVVTRRAAVLEASRSFVAWSGSPLPRRGRTSPRPGADRHGAVCTGAAELVRATAKVSSGPDQVRWSRAVGRLLTRLRKAPQSASITCIVAASRHHGGISPRRSKRAR